jgi:hypothetical protein
MTNSIRPEYKKRIRTLQKPLDYVKKIVTIMAKQNIFK